MTNNPKGEFLYRMLGSILSTYSREFGSEPTKRMIRYIAESEEFWKLAETIENLELEADGKPPFKRPGAHDFMNDGNQMETLKMRPIKDGG